MGLLRQDVIIVDVVAGLTPFPVDDSIAGVVITGSHAMVTEHHEWSEQSAKWIRQVVERSIPVLGICYGHQLLAYAFGGKVGNNQNGQEFGTTPVQVCENALDDPLFQSLPTTFPVHVSHTQSVLKPPSEAHTLAVSERDPHQAFVINECAWGVQFHPEFDVEITREYIGAYATQLTLQGVNPQQLAYNCKATPESTSLLRRFRMLIEQRGERGLDE